MTESEFRESVLRLVADPVDGLSFEKKAAIVRDAVTAKSLTATSRAYLQGLQNALLCLLGVLALAGGLTATVWRAWGVPLLAAVLGSLLALWGITMAVILGIWLRNRNSSGSVLLDLGPNPGREVSRKLAWSFGVLAVSAASAIGWQSIAAAAAITAGGALFAASLLLMGRGRLQVRENGLWVGWELLPWGRIGSWRWEGDSTLWLRTTGFFSWFQRVVPIAPAQRQEAHELLLKHCSTVAPPNEALQPPGAAHDGLPGSTAPGRGPGG
jgi:hypothetical protein